MKKYKILIPVLSAVAAASIGLAFFAPKIFNNSGTAATKPFVFADSKYTPMLRYSGLIRYPLLKTDIENLFYLADPDGSASFYEYSNSVLSPYKGKVYTLKTTVSCSNQDIPVKLSYVKKSGKITGFGLFTTKTSKADVKLFEYAFFKVTKLPAGYGSSGALLLVDFDKENFFLNDKLYSEAFLLNLGNGNNERLVTDLSRTVGTDGAFRSDWVLLYDDFLETLGNKPFFLSSRDYNLDQKGFISDILTIADLRPPRTVTGILGVWARVTGKGTAYLRETAAGFKSILLVNKKETTVKEFQGNYFKDYLHSGNYVFNTGSGVLTDLLSGKDISTGYTKASADSVLSVSPDGSWAVIASINGSGAKASETLALCNLSSGDNKTISEPLLFSQKYANFSWIDNSTLLHIRPGSENGTGYSCCVVKMREVF